MCGKSSPAAFLFKIEATISEMWVYLGKKTKLGDEVGKTSRAGRHALGEGHREAAGEMVLGVTLELAAGWTFISVLMWDSILSVQEEGHSLFSVQ